MFVSLPAVVRPDRRRAAVAVLGCVLLASCGGDAADVADQVQEAGSDVAASLDDNATAVDESVAVVADGLREAGLETIASAVSGIDVAELAGGAEFTFFAPDDDAFLSMSADDLADLTSDEDQLAEVLRAHLVDRTVTADELTTLDEVTTVDGGTLPVIVDGDTVMVGGAEVVQTDVAVGDGIAHVVTAVLGGA